MTCRAGMEILASQVMSMRLGSRLAAGECTRIRICSWAAVTDLRLD